MSYFAHTSPPASVSGGFVLGVVLGGLGGHYFSEGKRRYVRGEIVKIGSRYQQDLYEFQKDYSTKVSRGKAALEKALGV